MFKSFAAESERIDAPAKSAQKNLRKKIQQLALSGPAT